MDVSRFWHKRGGFLRPSKKQIPFAASGKGDDFPEIDSTSAARSATGAGTAAAATAQRVGGGDGKPGPISGLHEINFNGPAFFLQICINKKLQTAFLINLIAIFWLIQSQTQ